jgi:hypothetical protein
MPDESKPGCHEQASVDAKEARSAGERRAGTQSDGECHRCASDPPEERAASLQSASVSPVCDIGVPQSGGAEQFQAVGSTGKPDVSSFHTTLRGRGHLLRLLERLPTFFQWQEIPLPAVRADHPDASLVPIECDASPDREVGQFGIAAE